MNRTFIFGRAYNVHNFALTVYYWSFYSYFVNSIIICLIVSVEKDVNNIFCWKYNVNFVYALLTLYNLLFMYCYLHLKKITSSPKKVK